MAETREPMGDPDGLVVRPATRSNGYGSRFSFFLAEWAGSLADLGTFVPIAFALTRLNGLNPSRAFLAAGLTYLVAGLFFGIPVPVQPLKAVAAIAIAQGLPAPTIFAAGLEMAVVLLVLALAGVMGLVGRLFSPAIIRGIQLGVGLMLVRSALALITGDPFAVGNGAAVGLQGVRHLLWVAMAVVTMTVLLVFKKIGPLATPLVVLGVAAVAGLALAPGVLAQPMGMAAAAGRGPSGATDLWLAFYALVIPQIPLTLGNAVFATSDVARRHFGPAGRRATPRSLALSMGVANLVSGLLGGVPVCHGSAGMTAHYRFGARTGLAGVLVGGMFCALALVGGGGALRLLLLIPLPVLGGFMALTGIEHAALVRHLQDQREFLVATCTGALAMVSGNMALGFLAGLAMEKLFLVARALEPRMSQ